LVINQTTLLVSFLKFWHILFILGYLVFVILRYLETNHISYTIHSSLLYNFNYILIFNSCYMVYYYRKSFYWYLETPSIFYNIITNQNNSFLFIKCLVSNLIY
jgi:hypothetical protein